MSSREQYIAELMRYVYAHFTCGDESIGDFMADSSRPNPNIRHMLRRKVYQKYAFTYNNIANAEQSLRDDGKKPSLGGICRTVQKPMEMYEDFGRAEKMVGRLIDEFEDYCRLLGDPDCAERLRQYRDMSHHKLAIMLTLIDHLDSVVERKLDRFDKEFKFISSDFISVTQK